MNKKLTALALALLLAGCASSPVAIKVDYLAGKGAYAPEAFIAVLNAPPSGSYVSIAHLEAVGAPGITQSQVLNALQQKAQALGANAIIVSDQSQQTAAPDVTFNPAGGQYAITAPQSDVDFSGIAIHIEKDSGTSD
jgi:hypothetical protein